MKSWKRRRTAALSAITISVMLIAVGCSSSSKSNATSTNTSSTTSGSGSGGSGAPSSGSDTTGVTSSQITIGTVADVSGPIPGLFQGAWYGSEAYADYINSQGGVNGRKLVVKTDDSGLSCNLTKNAVQSLSSQVFAFVGSSATFDNCEVPVFQAHPDLINIGYGYSDQMKALPNQFLFQPAPRGMWTGPYLSFKQLYPNAVTHAGGLYSLIPSSEDNYNQTTAMMKSIGYKFVYNNGSPYTTTNYTSQILAMKAAGVQYLYATNLDVEQDANLLNEMQQQNFHPQVVEADTAYDGHFFKLVNPGAAQGLFANETWLMYQGQDRNANAEVNTFLTWLNKVKPGFQPDVFSFFGWVSGALFVDALKKAGSNPTRQSLYSAIQSIHSYDDNGMLATSNPGQKQPGECWQRIQVQNDQWVHVTPTGATFSCNPGGYYYYNG